MRDYKRSIKPRSYEIPVGGVFGKATVLQAVECVGKRRVICQCECGNKFEVLLASLKNGNTSSCGCLLIGSRTTHGMTETPEYSAWAAMLQRCTNPKCSEWHNYGERGIKVCATWQESFGDFFAHIGRRPSVLHSIDRWPDHNGNYEPGNVRWATKKQQSRNTRRNIILNNGELLADAAEAVGVSIINARNRRDLGWPEAKLLLPVKTRGKYRTKKSRS